VTMPLGLDELPALPTRQYCVICQFGPLPYAGRGRPPVTCNQPSCRDEHRRRRQKAVYEAMTPEERRQRRRAVERHPDEAQEPLAAAGLAPGGHRGALPGRS
jgi:hypothetical protein